MLSAAKRHKRKNTLLQFPQSHLVLCRGWNAGPRAQFLAAQGAGELHQVGDSLLLQGTKLSAGGGRGMRCVYESKVWRVLRNLQSAVIKSNAPSEHSVLFETCQST